MSEDWSADKCVAGSCAAESEYGAFTCDKAFDDSLATAWYNTTADATWILYDFGAGVTHKIRKLTLSSSFDPADFERSPRQFILRASNTYPSDFAADGILLLSVDEPGDYWSEAQQETKDFTFGNYIEYRYHWIYMTDKQGDFGKGQEYTFAEITMHVWIGLDYKLSGTVKEKGVAVQRYLRAYVRSTGVLFSSVQSEANGTFALDAPDGTTEMFVIAFDDAPGSLYNDLIYGRVIGVLA